MKQDLGLIKQRGDVLTEVYRHGNLCRRLIQLQSRLCLRLERNRCVTTICNIIYSTFYFYSVNKSFHCLFASEGVAALHFCCILYKDN